MSDKQCLIINPSHYQGGMDYTSGSGGGGYGHLGMNVGGGSGASGNDPFGGTFSGNMPG